METIGSSVLELLTFLALHTLAGAAGAVGYLLTFEAVRNDEIWAQDDFGA